MDYNITWRKKDKNWQCIISYKVNGTWKQKSKQGFKTQKEGKTWIDKTVKELEKNIKNDVNNSVVGGTSFKEVTEMFLENRFLYKEHNTLKGYSNCFSKFKGLNDKKIIDIKKHDVQSIADKLIIEGLKSTTVKKYVGILNMLFEYARDDLNLIAELPTVNIKIPKEKTKSVKKALTKKELNLLLKKLRTNKFYIVAFIAANTGMRLGEVLGLTWNDLDEINMTLSVNKQWKVSKYKKSTFGNLKSKNSNRAVPISPTTLKELKNHKKNSPTDIHNRIAPFNHASIFEYLNPKLRELAGISIHELRHTYATLLISSGIDFKTAAKILGHDVEQTMRTYSHVTDDMMKKASDTISKIF